MISRNERFRFTSTLGMFLLEFKSQSQFGANNRSVHLQIEQWDAFNMDAMDVSVRQATNDQVSALRHRKAVDDSVKAEKLAVAAGFLLEQHQTFVHRQHDALILQGGKDAGVFDALK